MPLIFQLLYDGFDFTPFERFTELPDISNFPKHEIQYYNTNILVSHQGKSIPYYNNGQYACSFSVSS